jgi:hypothetical protein
LNNKLVKSKKALQIRKANGVDDAYGHQICKAFVLDERRQNHVSRMAARMDAARARGQCVVELASGGPLGGSEA